MTLTHPLRYLLTLLAVCSSLAWAEAASDGDGAMEKLAWQKGPTTGQIAGKATIKVPEGYLFLDEANTQRFLKLTGNLPQSGHYMLAPENLRWWSVFSFESSGYVKDDEKIDADQLLKSLQESDAQGNEERKRLGMEALFTDGWAVAPHYDAQTKRLEWAARLRTAGGQVNANYTSRLLGRSGVMSATLVSDLDRLDANTSEYKAALQQFDYVAGEKYSEFKEGDKVAQYGLAALVLGGAAAVATKKGLWGAIGAFLAASWKLIAAGAVALLAGIGKLFKRDKT